MIPDFVDTEDLQDLIDLGLREDVGTGDITSNATIAPSTNATGVFTAKDDGIIAGLEVAQMVFETVDSRLRCTWNIPDGTPVSVGEEIGIVEGSARHILLGERLALNFIQRMSGVATATAAMVARAKPHGTQILDTRKTIPGFRTIDKWAVLLGGGTNHRMGLFDMALIKDNHIVAAGGVEEALQRASDFRRKTSGDYKIEIEAKTLYQVRIIVESGLADIIMLDNMVSIDADGEPDVTMLEEAVEIIDGRMFSEASGNVTLDTVGIIASTGVDAISSGSLTHSVRAFDISLNVTIS